MEIKVHCACGQKFAFDAVPVQGRMPHAVNCPACGEDGTALANEYMRQQIATQAAPVAMLVNETPVAAAVPAPALLRAPAPGGLRVNRPAHADTPPPPPAGAPPPPRPMPQYANAPVRPQKSKNSAPTIIAIVVVFVVIGFGAWKIGRKALRFIGDVKEAANAFNEIANMKFNFQETEAVVLYVQHTNHVEVAEACKDFWRDSLKRNLTATPATSDDGIGDKEYGVYEDYNGWVRVMSSLEWPSAEFEPLAQHLSQKFSALVFETCESDESEAYHFGVLEAGTRKFHIRTELKLKKGDYDIVVKTEGEDWALANGFKPDEDGFKGFTSMDADKISQKLGMKIWDEPEDHKSKMLLLKEAAK